MSRLIPDITYALNRICQYMPKPTKHHYSLLLHILRYLRYTRSNYIVFSSADQMCMSLFCDANFNEPDSRSITGLCGLLNDNLILFKSKKQTSL